MGSSAGISEIVEFNEELKSVRHSNRSKSHGSKSKADEKDGLSHGHPVEDNLDRLLRAIDLRASSRVLGPSHQAGVDLLQKSTLKKPVKVGISQASGIGTSESVTLKQALRRLCISQASEMAAMKRLSKPIGLSGVSEAGTIKKLFASVVVQSNDSGLSLDEEKRNLVEISIVPEKVAMESSGKATDFIQKINLESSNRDADSSPLSVADHNTAKVPKFRIQDVLNPTSAKNNDNPSVAAEKEKGKMISVTSVASLWKATESRKPAVSPCLIKPVFRSKTCIRKKGKREPASNSGSSSRVGEVDKAGAAMPGKTKSSCQKESVSPASIRTNPAGAVATVNIGSGACKPVFSPNNCSGGKAVGVKTTECLRSREKGECSQSSKSSIGDYSSSTSISEDSHQSGSSSTGRRPHMSKDSRWVAIHRTVTQQESFGLKNFKLLKRLGCGDIGTVYLAELIGSECLFALKVMDIEFLVSRKKMLRAQTEREILQMLDHPFLPTLFSHFMTDNLSCLVMEYCPGGDLHVIRQRQPGRFFSEPASRFYVAEVLLALEYLHLLGVIYRDLKPENILVRDDGHIMLSDFDLSLRCSVSPTLLRSSSLGTEGPVKKLSGPCAENRCIDPLCIQPSWVHASCFTPRLVSSTMAKTHKLKADLCGQVSTLPQLVVEPTDARSNSFVGTHEYLAPEIIRGEGHGSAVDWWTFGIFLYELLFGRTPFKGPGNEETLANVISQSLKFPESPAVSFHAKDLIRGLLVKEPENRLGSVRGAAEIKQHPFFEGLNWALIRCAVPPETPRSCDIGTPVAMHKKKEAKCLDFRSNGEHVEFELF